MAHKRTAGEAFGQPQGQVSAVAAAKLRRQQQSSREAAVEPNALAAEVASLASDAHSSASSGREPDPTVRHHVVQGEREHPLTLPGSSSSSSLTEVNASSTLHHRLTPGEPSVFLGEYDLDVLDPIGAVTVAGSVLRAKDGPVRIYAPSTHALPQLRALGRTSLDVRLSSIKTGMRKLEKLSPMFRNIWNSHAGTAAPSFVHVGDGDDALAKQPLKSLEIDKTTDAVLRHLSAKAANAGRRMPRIMAIGPKSSGKSTFNRLLCNYIHTLSPQQSCSYLDLDPGQPEFSLPGQLSLVKIDTLILGPPFTHPGVLFPSTTMAATSFRDDAQHYKACVADLAVRIDKRFPLVVNSSGWISGLGAEVTLDIVKMLAITDIVLLEPLEDSLTKALQETVGDAATFHRVPRRLPKRSSRTPAESRSMQMLSYFHHRPVPTNTNSIIPLRWSNEPLRWSGKALSKVRPWIVNYAGSNPDIAAILSYGQSPEPEFLAEVLDGSIVAINTLRMDDDDDEDSITFLHPNGNDCIAGPQSEADAKMSDIVAYTPAEGLPYIPPDAAGINRPLHPRKSSCYGLALVRAIDVEAKQLHLISPSAESFMRLPRANKTVVLVRGGFDVPEWAYLEDLFHSDAEKAKGSQRDGGSSVMERPWVSERNEKVGIEGSVWRLRHPPTALPGNAG